MSLGTVLRRSVGSHERALADLYRQSFIDLDAFAALLGRWVPDPRNILEVGCGELAMTERLALGYPKAAVVAIVVNPRLGRLYQGPVDRVSFHQVTVESLAPLRLGAFDLVVLCDVLHHVPPAERESLLRAIRKVMSSDGKFAFKDWAATPTWIHALGFASDRFITGDRVAYLSEDELRGLAQSIFGKDSILASDYVPPRRNNLALLIGCTS